MTLSGYIKDVGRAAKRTDDVKIHIKRNDRDGYYLCLTRLRGKSLKKNISKLKKIDITEDYSIDPNSLKYKELKDTTKIFFPDLSAKSDKLVEYREEIIELVTDKYKKLLAIYYKKYQVVLKRISNFVAFTDFIKSCAKTAVLYGYCKPEIDDEPEHGYIRATKIRHPISERIIQDVAYIPHDVCIGKGPDDNTTEGILLHGCNGSGKSLYMKAIGLSIIMAQCGMYVPAESFTYSPYTSLLCRITGNDNLFKGLSSFALEMTELRAILQRCGPKALIIGDEVCRGTEAVSGNAIVASTVIQLAKSGSSFIFATHLHKIARMERIKNLINVKPYYLSVDYDEDTDTLVFDRKLKQGSGPEVYGLTVASHIIHDKDFIKLAQEIKKEQLSEPNAILAKKTSPHNSNVYVDECALCGSKVNLYGNLHTHHIIHQKDSVKGFVNKHIKENQEANLIILCRKCHKKVHKENISMKYVRTSKGRKLRTRRCT